MLISNKVESSRKKIASVQKAIDILNLFNSDIPEMGNKEIAIKLNIPTGTVSGLIYTLKANHYLDQNPENQKYRLGLKLLDRASVLLDQIDIRKLAYPQLKELSKWSGESVNLAVLDEGEIVYIERLHSAHPLGINYELGRTEPIHSTALGKAIVAHLPQNEIAALLNDYNFFSVTRNTIIDKHKFEDELAAIRERGYSLDDEENEIGGRCVSAPILDKKSYPIAAISVSIPIHRIPDKRIKEYGKKLLEATRAVSRIIGFRS
jgi:DNA-binding IclR family transcriptional regulator